jgi:hypothetical protein
MLVSQRSYFGCARSLPARTDAKIDPELSERGAELKLSSSQRRRRFRHSRSLRLTATTGAEAPQRHWQ